MANEAAARTREETRLESEEQARPSANHDKAGALSPERIDTENDC